MIARETIFICTAQHFYKVPMSNQPQLTSPAQQAINEPLVLHSQDRATHFAADAHSLAAHYADPVIYVRDGGFSRIPDP
jgi:hypothetical protein